MALYDAVTGQTYQYRPGVVEDEASIAKVDILATLLYQAQVQGRPLSASDQQLAAAMIENSDNDAADQLWDEAGGGSAVGRFNQLAGLVQTTPNSGEYWGLSTTTALDQAALLRLIAYPNSVLTDASRAYVLSLMGQVETDQAWGVSGGVPSSATVALKNGWLPVDDTWQVNSVGYIHGDGHDYVLTALVNGDPSETDAIQTITGLSSLVWNELSPN